MTDEVSNVDVVLVEPITQYVTTEPTVNDEVSNVDVVFVEPITHAETFTKLQVDDGDALEEQKKRLLIEHNKMESEKSHLERNLETERKNVVRLQQVVDDTKSLNRQLNDEVQLLNKEVDKLRSRETEFNREITMLKREQAMTLGRAQNFEESAKKSYTDIEHKAKIIASLENTIEEMQHQSSQYKKSMEKMKVENSNVMKDFNDSQKIILGLEQEKKDFEHVTDALREQISSKDAALMKESCAVNKEKALKDAYVEDITMLKKRIVQNEETIQSHLSDARRLETAVRKLEDAAATQKREYDHALHERDVLGTSLIQKEEEMKLMFENMKIQESTQRRGELQYNARVEDIRILNLKVKELSRLLAIAQGGQAGVDDMSKQLMALQKDYMREQQKVKALSDELETPLNVHRWHKLEGSDPEAYELLQQLQILQKRLLQKSDEVVNRNALIRDLEHRQRELEQELARRPGPDVAEKLNFYKSDVIRKEKQIKAMTAELNMHQTQVHDFKNEIERLETELFDYKKRYFEQKKRDMVVKGTVSDIVAPSSSNIGVAKTGGVQIVDIPLMEMKKIPLVDVKRVVKNDEPLKDQSNSNCAKARPFVFDFGVK
jgi:chromosome segregation ATPase